METQESKPFTEEEIGTHHTKLSELCGDKPFNISDKALDHADGLLREAKSVSNMARVKQLVQIMEALAVSTTEKYRRANRDFAKVDPEACKKTFWIRMYMRTLDGNQAKTENAQLADAAGSTGKAVMGTLR